MSSIFRIIETFFFISLGITFILVLLLVFHFKMRLLTLEGKHDTTLEIINNIVGELQHMKKLDLDSGCDPVAEIKKVYIPVYESNGSNGYIENNKIVVSDGESDIEIDYDEGEEDISHSDEDDEKSDDDSDEGDEESDDNSDEGDEEKGDDDIDMDENDTFDIKVIKLNEDTNEVVVKEIDIEVQNGSSISSSEEAANQEPIDDDSECNNDVDNTSQNIDNYRKLNLQSLKTIAISKGLSPDPSKLKKKELLHLLA